jgi:hypothetical protein
MTERRLPPAHLAVIAGFSAGAYAISLAGVTALQAGADARLIADRAPALEATAAMTAGRDDLEARLAAVSAEYDALAERYRRAGGSLAGLEEAMDSLAGRTAALSESAAKLPTRFSLPVVRAASRQVSAPPKTTATTRASG